MNNNGTVTSILSFDVEEWFHAVPDFSAADWTAKESTLDEEFEPVREIVTGTERAFVLTTLTTMAGFGSLIWPRYKGLNSFGFVTILGMTFVLLTSLVALPAFLVLLERCRAGRTGADASRPSEKGGPRRECYKVPR